MFCGESVGNIKFRAFPKAVSVHEFYRLKASISSEQVNTTEWSKKIRILISKTAMVGSAYLLHGNFGGKFPSNGTGIFFGTENMNGIELYHLQNTGTGKVFAFSGHQAWH